MTVPEENQEKTETTDDTLSRSAEEADRGDEGAGRGMREALEEAGVTPDDYEER